LNSGDALLLCSDGLSGFVTDDEICTTLKKHRDVQSVPQELVNLALSAGGNDNITIQFVRVDGTVRKRVTAALPVSQVIAQGRTGDAVATLAKRGLLVFVAIAALLLAAVSTRASLAPPTVQLDYDPATEMLTWTAPEADSVNIQPEVGPTASSGQRRVSRGTTAVTYKATATAKRLLWTVTSTAVEKVVPAATAKPKTPPGIPPAEKTPPPGPDPSATATPPPEPPTITAKPAPKTGAGKASGKNTGKDSASPAPASQPPPNQAPAEEPSPANGKAQASPSQPPAPDAAGAPVQAQEPVVNTPPGQPDE
jgi:hypothetical protein